MIEPKPPSSAKAANKTLSERPSDMPVWSEEEATESTRVTEVLIVPPEPRARDRATLTIVSGPDTGRVFSLDNETLIGRSRDCTIHVDETSVSRVHARIMPIAGGQRFLLEDLNSRNGTFVDGYRVKQHELQDGQRVQIGPQVHFRFAITDDVEEGLLRRLYESSVRDPLTGIFNRKHFNERLLAEIAYAVRHRTDLALLIFDLDHFKLINDEHGHLAGDKVLRSMAGLVGRTIRTEDIFARYGGEEFAVVVRGVDGKGMLVLGERIRAIIERAHIDFEGKRIPVTASVGVATLACCGPGEPSAEGLIAVADRRLYEAKETGRNRVIGPRL